MPNRAFVVHGWSGSPREAWQGWLADELTARNWLAINVIMPAPNHPEIESWVKTLSQAVGQPDEKTAFVGGSIGCQTILRYLAGLPVYKVGRVVLVAPWIHLKDAAYESPEDREIGRPWIETPIDWTKAKRTMSSCTILMSTNDPYVPISDADIFERELGIPVQRLDGRGHFTADDGVLELPEALDSLLKSA